MGELLDVARRLAERARPGEDIEAFVARNRTTTVRAFGGDVESFTSAEASGAGIRVVTDGRLGFAHAGSLDRDVLDATLDDARDNARFAEPDPCAGLARPDGVEPAELVLEVEAVAATGSDEKIATSVELEAATRDHDPAIVGVRTSIYGDAVGETAVATSTGLTAVSSSSRCSISVSALASDGDETTVGYWYDAARDPAQLDVSATAAEAGRRAVRLLGAAKPASRRVTLLLEPRLVSTLLGVVAGLLGAEAVQKGRSLYADRLGDDIAHAGLTLVDDATDPRSLAAGPHDGEGLATRPNPLIVAGRLERFLHNSTTARRAGVGSTGSAVRGYASTPGAGWRVLRVAAGPAPAEEIVEQIDDGVLVQSMSGLHSGVNSVSGDFSVGIEGMVIRGGGMAEPVREATIATTLPRLLSDITAIGDDLTWLPGGNAAPTLAIANVALSGT